jgi:hypothetical protein
MAVEPERALDGLAHCGLVVDHEDAHGPPAWRPNLRGT